MSEIAKGTITGKSVPEDISKYCRLTLDDGHDYITKDKDIRVGIENAEMGDYAEIEYRRIEKKDKSGQFNAIDKLILKGKTAGKPEEKGDEFPYEEEAKATVAKRATENESRLRSMALAYSKDVAIAILAKSGAIEAPIETCRRAEVYYRWLISVITIEDETVAQWIAQGKYKKIPEA